MTQTQNTQTNGTSNGAETNGASNKQPKMTSALDAIKKITKVLDQLSPTDRRRVLAFVNESNHDAAA
jgi:hypothetical protein